MNLRLVKASEEYRSQISNMMEEWNSIGEKIVPYAIRRLDVYTGARKAPIRRAGNHQSGHRKSLVRHCGRAASPVWREPPFRTNGAT